MKPLKFDLTVDASALLCPNASEFYSKAYISSPEIVGNFRTLPGIKYATEIATVDFDNILKASSCTFSAGDDVLSSTTVTVCAVSALAEICRFDLEQSFISLNMAQGSNGQWQVADFMSFYWGEMAKEIGSEIEEIRWKGNTTNTAYTGTYLALCDGYEKGLAADASVVDVTASAVTVANVISVLTAIVNALPAKLKNKLGDLRLFVSPAIALAYRIAASQGNTQSYVTQSLDLTFLGIKMVVAEGLTDGKAVLTTKDNLIYAFDGEGDSKELKAIDLSDTVAEPKLRTRANMKIGFKHINGNEIVYFA
jgi:hypothetical protein